MSTTRRIRRNTIKLIALGFAAAAVSAGAASAHVDTSQSSIPVTSLPDGGNYDYSSDNSVATIARQDLEQRRVLATQPDGYQPQLRGEEPLVIRDAPDGYQPQLRGVEVSATSSSSGVEWSDVGFGITLALILAALSALMVAGVRNRARAAHS